MHPSGTAIIQACGDYCSNYASGICRITLTTRQAHRGHHARFSYTSPRARVCQTAAGAGAAVVCAEVLCYGVDSRRIETVKS